MMSQLKMKEQITRVVPRLFRESGYNGTSLRKIMRQAFAL